MFALFQNSRRRFAVDAKLRKRLITAALVLGGVVLLAVLWRTLRPSAGYEGLVSGNGRIEATEINVSAKLGGRIEDILVREGDFVRAQQPLVRMQIDTLHAQRDEALAAQRQAITSVSTAKAQVAMRRADLAAAGTTVVQAESSLDAAERRQARSETLSKEGAASVQEFDDDRARTRSARASLDAARAQAVAAQSAIDAAQAQVTGADAAVAAAAATVARIDADIRDSVLSSPRDGRVQYLIAQTGEVVPAGAPVLNVVDIGDVFMTFFLPTAVVGRVPLGSEVRIVLDTAPRFPIPARISFVSDTAQFTPRTVETASERQKLMFRVRAHIDRQLLEQHLKQVKTGVPGVAWLKIDPNAKWPESLTVRLAE
jgi:HlyD family secretion protein